MVNAAVVSLHKPKVIREKRASAGYVSKLYRLILDNLGDAACQAGESGLERKRRWRTPGTG
jgi:hypothetical protein